MAWQPAYRWWNGNGSSSGRKACSCSPAPVKGTSAALSWPARRAWPRSGRAIGPASSPAPSISNSSAPAAPTTRTACTARWPWPRRWNCPWLPPMMSISWRPMISRPTRRVSASARAGPWMTPAGSGVSANSSTSAPRRK